MHLKTRYLCTGDIFRSWVADPSSISFPMTFPFVYCHYSTLSSLPTTVIPGRLAWHCAFFFLPCWWGFLKVRGMQAGDLLHWSVFLSSIWLDYLNMPCTYILQVPTTCRCQRHNSVLCGPLVWPSMTLHMIIYSERGLTRNVGTLGGVPHARQQGEHGKYSHSDPLHRDHSCCCEESCPDMVWCCWNTLQAP